MKIIIKFLIVISCLSADFIRDDSLNIVIDTSRNIMWQDINISVEQTKIWKNSNKYCEDLEFGTFNDWRLPHLRELQSIIDINRSNPAISDVFKYVNTASYYFSLNTYMHYPNQVYAVNFLEGVTNIRFKNDKNYFRCMRTVK